MEENFYAFSTSFLTFFMAFIFGCGGCEMGIGALFFLFGVRFGLPLASPVTPANNLLKRFFCPKDPSL